MEVTKDEWDRFVVRKPTSFPGVYEKVETVTQEAYNAIKKSEEVQHGEDNSR